MCRSQGKLLSFEFLLSSFVKVLIKECLNKISGRKSVSRKIYIPLLSSYNMKIKDYLQEEVNYIKENYGKILVVEIAKKLNRKPEQIRDKASRLGLNSNLPQSKETRQKINEANTKKINESAYNPSKNLAYILGVLNGDGYITFKKGKNYFLRLAVKDKDFALNFKRVLENWSGLCIHFYKRKDIYYKQGYYYEIILCSKNAINFLLKYYISINKQSAIKKIKDLLFSKKEYQIKFIEGFYDSEGYFGGNRIGFSNTNYYLILLIKEFLDYLGINSKIYKNKSRINKIRKRKFLSKKSYRLYIQYKQGIVDFFKIIKSSIKRKNPLIPIKYCIFNFFSMVFRKAFRTYP